jgi:hypothetical protein
MYYYPSHFKDQLRRYLFLSLSPALIICFLLALPAVSSGEEGNMGVTAVDSMAERGVVFRIQDYIPGTFESRLQYVSLNGGTTRAWNRPIVLGRSGSYYSSTRYYYLPLREDFIETNTTSTGTYKRSVHRESPRRTIDSEIYINGYYAPNKTRNLDDGIKIDQKGYGRNNVGTREDNKLSTYVTYTTNRWYYTRNSWAYHFNPTLQFQRNKSIRQEDLEYVYERYYVSDPLVLDYRRKREYNRDDDDDQLQTIAHLYVAAGRGRVYDGTSSWRAIDLLETVAEISGIPTAELSSENYKQLASVLYDLHQRKYPTKDSKRLQDFERTETVVEEIERGLQVDNLSPRAIAAIHDILKYYPTFTRSFGQRWYFSVGGYYWNIRQANSRKYHETYYDNPDEHYARITKDNDERISREQKLRTSAGLVYESYQPLSTHWQLNVRGSAYLHEEYEAWEGTYESLYWSHHWGSDTSESFSESGDTTDCWQSKTSATFRIGGNLYYIIDSQTWWEFSATAWLDRAKYLPNTNINTDDLRRQDITSWSGRLEGEAKYHRYLAWKLYLTASLKCRFDYGDVTHTRTDWADYQGGAGWYNAIISLEYYL